MTSEAQTEGLVGHALGDYRVVRLIGQGGMGAVYEIWSPATCHRAAAKILFPEITADQRWVTRLLSEAQAANLAEHPGIVKVFGSGMLEVEAGRRAYLLMEYVDGESLWQRMGRLRRAGQPVPLPQIVYVARQVASALAAVHAQGIIHRDLKPENILLCADPEVPAGERTKLVDFGIARLPDGVAGRRTTGDRVFGTPLYMSPEQCRGAEISDKSDVYALGVVLYEMAVGRTPFRHLEAGTLMSMHIRDEAPPIEREDLPRALRVLIAAMLAKDPADRPAIVEVADDLEQIEEALHRPRPARSPEPDLAPAPLRAPTPTMSVVRRSLPRVVPLVPLVPLVLVLGLAVAAGLWLPGRPPMVQQVVAPQEPPQVIVAEPAPISTAPTVAPVSEEPAPPRAAKRERRSSSRAKRGHRERQHEEGGICETCQDRARPSTDLPDINRLAPVARDR